MTLLSILRFAGTPPDTLGPSVTIVSVSKSKISRVSGYDATDVVFVVDENFTNYQVRVVPSSSSGVTAGTQVEGGLFVGTANTNYQITLTDDELVAAGAAEGNNRIKVFAQDIAGNWSA